MLTSYPELKKQLILYLGGNIFRNYIFVLAIGRLVSKKLINIRQPFRLVH